MNEIQQQVFLSVNIIPPDKPQFELPLGFIPSMWIIEDLDMVVPCVSIVYAESMSELSELLPLLGNEQLQIHIGLDKNNFRTFNFKYFSYSTHPLSAIDSRYKEIVMNWIDKDFIQFNSYPTTTSYPKTRNSDCAAKLLSGLPTVIETSDNSHDHYFPNITIGKSVKDLAKETYSSGSSYWFYKNHDKYYFQSRNKTFRTAQKYSYVWGYSAFSFKFYGNNRSALTNVFSDVYGYNYDNGNYIEKSQTANSIVGKKVRLGHQSPFGTDTNVNTRYTYTGTRSETQIDAMSSHAVESFMDQAFKMSFISFGNYDLSCGDIIKIEVQSASPQNEIHNMVASGLWLVKKIVHFYGGRTYWNKVYCVSNSALNLNRKLVI